MNTRAIKTPSWLKSWWRRLRVACQRWFGGAHRAPATDQRVDEALEETFPASDPPSYMGGSRRSV